jgi:uncharacterized protein
MMKNHESEILESGLLAKRDRLLKLFHDLESVAVAFSGGVDSSVVAMAAHLALKDRAIAVTADSPSVARGDFDDAERTAKLIGIRHVVMKTEEFDDPNYLKNDGTRCYFCKSELYSRIERLLPNLGANVICSGANLDDAGDYRPGLVAAAEHAVRHPLQETGFTKNDVRALAKAWQLPIWEKPASPCLSSRIAPGLAVTPQRTERVERAERYLKSLGVKDGRVRYHDGDLARIEVLLADLEFLAGESVRGELVAAFQKIGFRFVTLDLAGFRSGSLNDLIPLEVKAAMQRPLTPVTP